MPDGASRPWERADAWHFDNDPHLYTEAANELMLFTFYSSVGPRGGGTLLLSGSPRLVARYITVTAAAGTPDGLPNTEGLAQWHPWLAEMLGHSGVDTRPTATLMEAEVDVHGVPVRIVELTGEPGDAFLCHPAMLHAVSANCSRCPASCAAPTSGVKFKNLIAPSTSNSGKGSHRNHEIDSSEAMRYDSV